MSDLTALVLFSGGQDSATCLAWALDRFERVETIGFDYGQRHRVELEVRAHNNAIYQRRRAGGDWDAPENQYRNAWQEIGEEASEDEARRFLPSGAGRMAGDEDQRLGGGL